MLTKAQEDITSEISKMMAKGFSASGKDIDTLTSKFDKFTKALDAQYDALYSTGKDVLEKKQEKLNEEINREAIELATDSIVRADKYKQIEELKKEQKIKERANELIDQYKDQMDEVTYKGAKAEIKKAKIKNTANEDK